MTWASSQAPWMFYSSYVVMPLPSTTTGKGKKYLHCTLPKSNEWIPKMMSLGKNVSPASTMGRFGSYLKVRRCTPPKFNSMVGRRSFPFQKVTFQGLCQISSGVGIFVTTPLMLEGNLNPRMMEISPDRFLGAQKTPYCQGHVVSVFHPIW